ARRTGGTRDGCRGEPRSVLPCAERCRAGRVRSDPRAAGVRAPGVRALGSGRPDRSSARRRGTRDAHRASRSRDAPAARLGQGGAGPVVTGPPPAPPVSEPPVFERSAPAAPTAAPPADAALATHTAPPAPATPPPPAWGTAVPEPTELVLPPWGGLTPGGQAT